jgi:phosphoglycolate phosphatase-like HAD superfamily hydrolase
VYDGPGYIERERLIPSGEELELLAGRYRLGIATGRPRMEAEHALERFGLTGLFPVMVTEDDVTREEARRGERLRKPHPYSLQVCMRRCGLSSGREGAGRSAYVGDMPDDMVVARRAGVLPVGFVNERADESPQEREEHRAILQRHGAALVVSTFRELIRSLERRWP